MIPCFPDIKTRYFLADMMMPCSSEFPSVGAPTRFRRRTCRPRHPTSQQIEIARNHRELGRIEFSVGTAVRTIAGWRIPRSSVAELAELYRSLPVWESSDPSDWIPAREATRRFGRCGLTFVRLLELIRGGHVRGCREAHANGWTGLRVPLQDLQSARPEISEKRDRCEGYPLNRLGRVLIPGRPLKESVLRKWIRAGLLQAEHRGRIWHVALDEVERFRSTYSLADDACRMLRISRSTLARQETAGEISAVYSRRTHSGAGASVFRRDDVLRMRAE